MKRIALTILACARLTLAAAAQDYDLVINNGRVFPVERLARLG